MAEDVDIRREQVRDLLQQASIEIGATLERLESMESFELAEVRGAAGGLVAFFDKNGTCATGDFDPVAFFDKNGTCAAAELRRFDAVAFFDKNGTCAGEGGPGLPSEVRTRSST
jgi:hypothetical protein